MTAILHCALPALKCCKSAECCAVATTFDGFCRRCSKCRSLRNYNDRPTTTSANRVGVELELVHPEGEGYVAQLARYVCRDGSLPIGGGECKLLGRATGADIVAQATDLAQRAALHGAVAMKQCGLHVHLSMPHPIAFNRGRVTIEGVESQVVSVRVQAMFDWLLKAQSYFFDIMPPSRRENGYCRRLVNPACLRDHYSWMSMSRSVPTIECRLHGATTNPWKMRGWMETMLRLRAVLADILLGSIDSETADALATRFSDALLDGSIGRKYLLAREKMPTLPRFGFA